LGYEAVQCGELIGVPVGNESGDILDGNVVDDDTQQSEGAEGVDYLKTRGL
jgi:hypothetical protein